MYKPLLIYSNIQINNQSVSNTPLKEACSNSLLFSMDGFNLADSDLDTFISKEIIPKINQSKFDILFIKDNLSDNYIELYGVILAYHIRLSKVLKNKRFVPIVIVSDLDGYVLNKLTDMAKILFTKNVFVAKNELTTYTYFEKVFKQIKPITDLEKDFLGLMTVEAPKDYLSHHSITNEWSIDKWSRILGVNSNAIEKNHEKISSMLYYKYLQSKYILNEDNEAFNPESTTSEGKILYIDDEWEKGWSDILKNIFGHSESIEFETFEYDFQDKSEFNLFVNIQKKVRGFDPDVVILDLRLSDNDHDQERSVDEYLGMDVLKKIHEINEGIQVVMLTASNKSTTLDKLLEKNILGYVKKDNPNDILIDTEDNINKLVSLVDKGLQREYLKKIVVMQRKVLQLDILDLENEHLSKIKFEINNVFNLLNSNLEKRVTFTILAFYNIIELIIKYKGFDFGSAYGHITKICRVLELYDYDNDISQLICTRNFFIHAEDKSKIMERCQNNTIFIPNESHLIDWFEIIYKIINRLDYEKLSEV